jgi:hypothetical protein
MMPRCILVPLAQELKRPSGSGEAESSPRWEHACLRPEPRGCDNRHQPALTPVERASVHVTALGLGELPINGQRIGDHLLTTE